MFESHNSYEIFPSIPYTSMVWIEGGFFMMGSNRFSSEQPIHKVELSGFYLGQYLVTQHLWEWVMDNNPSMFQGDKNLPVDSVSWVDCQGFLNALNGKMGLDMGNGYCLPTEAQWEYAARGAGLSEGYMYPGSNEIREVAWHDVNSQGKTHPVGRLKPNELGLYDMSGNLWEWCKDFSYDYPKDSLEDPGEVEEEPSRIIRGGAWISPRILCSPTLRLSIHPSLGSDVYGFRVARTV